MSKHGDRISAPWDELRRCPKHRARITATVNFLKTFSPTVADNSMAAELILAHDSVLIPLKRKDRKRLLKLVPRNILTYAAVKAVGENKHLTPT